MKNAIVVTCLLVSVIGTRATAQDINLVELPHWLLDGLQPPLRRAVINSEGQVSGTLRVVECNGFFGFGYETIQEAIDASADGDVVLVLPRNHQGIECDGDTYLENISFQGKAITVISATGPQHTIIDGGDVDGVVLFENDEGPNSVLHGFTLTDGNRLPGAGGGGIRCWHSSPTISNCVVANCVAEVGGGIYVFRGSPLIRNCLIKDNSAYAGVGVACSGFGQTLITGSTVVNNSTMGGFNTGGGVSVGGAGNSVMLVNSIVWANSAERGPQLSTRVGASLTVVYSNVEAGESAVFIENAALHWSCGTIDLDPLFVDPDAGDYHIRLLSPARNAGDPDFVPGGGETDLDGDPRVLEGRTDMGADEHVTKGSLRGPVAR